MVLLLLLAYGCQSEKAVSPEEYVRWVRDAENGLRITQAQNGFDFELQYKPHTYEALMQFSHPKAVNQEQVNEHIDAIKGHQYLNLTISSQQGENIIEQVASSDEGQADRQTYFLYGMRENLYLLQGQDTLPCLMFHQEQDPTNKSRKRFLLSFAGHTNTQNQGCKLLFEDAVLGTGPVSLELPAKRFENMPSILYQKS